MKKASDETEGFGSKLKALVAPLAGLAAGFASFKTIESAIDKTREFGGEVSKLQRETGVSAEEASRLIVAFNHVGLSGDDASTSLGIFNKNILNTSFALQQGKTATSPFTEAMTALGIKVVDSSNKARDGNVVFLETADKFKNLDNSGQKAALAIDVFGKSGKDMLPILNQGSDGIKQLGAAADRLGLTLTQNNVDAIKKYNASQREMNDAIAGLKLQIGLEVMPILTKFANWFVEHQPEIREFFDKVIAKVEDLAKTFADGFGEIAKDLSWIPDHEGEVSGAFADIGLSVVLAFGSGSPAQAAVVGLIGLIGKLKEGFSVGGVNIGGTQGGTSGSRGLFGNETVQGNIRQILGGQGTSDKILNAITPGFLQSDEWKDAEKAVKVLKDMGITTVAQFNSMDKASIGLNEDLFDTETGMLKNGAGLQAIKEAQEAAARAAADASKGVNKFGSGLNTLPTTAAKEKVDKFAEALQRMRDSLENALQDGTVSFKEFTDMNQAIAKSNADLAREHLGQLDMITVAEVGQKEAAIALATALDGNAEQTFNFQKNMVKLEEVMKSSIDTAKKLGSSLVNDFLGKVQNAFNQISGSQTKEGATLALQIAEVQQRIAGFQAASGGQDITAALAPTQALLKSLQDKQALDNANLAVDKAKFDVANRSLPTEAERQRQLVDLIGLQSKASTIQQQLNTDNSNASTMVQNLTFAFGQLMQQIAVVLPGGSNDLRLSGRGV